MRTLFQGQSSSFSGSFIKSLKTRDRCAESLDQAWRALELRKANMQHPKPKLAAQIVLSGLARTRSLPAERLFHYERILQEEERLRQAMIFCQGDLAELQAQIEVIQLELSFLL